jgi:hypothetical protein
MIEDSDAVDHGPWPERAALLGALGILFGLTFWKLTQGPERWQWTNSPIEMAGATFVAVSGVVFALSLERLRWRWSIAFAAACGLVAAFVGYWNGAPQDWGTGEGWQFAAAVIAAILAVPLFEAARDTGAARFPLQAVHAHLWTDAIIGAVAMVFVGAVLLLTLLLAALFDLIGIRLLRDAMNEGWFMWPLACGAFGAAVGILRDRDPVIGVSQRVARAILSVLAPALALGLVFFVLALPFTGLEPLWEKTRSTTPILLFCVLGAVILLNAVIGNAPEEEAKARVLRWSATALAAVALPLAIVAAVSTGLRIGQYGLTPDRLWAAVFILVAIAFASAYLYALIRARASWPAQVRRLNVALALGTCGLALFLALPILSFGALSTRDQLSRLESGKVTPEQFDWRAMRFDFGPTGRAAVQRLVTSNNPRNRELAAAVLKAKHPYDFENPSEAASLIKAGYPSTIIVRPLQVPLPPELRQAVLPDNPIARICAGPGECLLFWRPGQTSAVAILDGCAASIVGRAAQTRPGVGCTIDVTPLNLRNGRWTETSNIRDGAAPEEPERGSPQEAAMLRAERAAIDRGDVVIREVTRRQVFIGGKPVSQLFE